MNQFQGIQFAGRRSICFYQCTSFSLNRHFLSGLLLSIPFAIPSISSVFQLCFIIPGLICSLDSKTKASRLSLLALTVFFLVWVYGSLNYGGAGIKNFAYVPLLFFPVDIAYSYKVFYSCFTRKAWRMCALCSFFLAWPLLNIPLSPSRQYLSTLSFLSAFIEFEDKAYNPMGDALGIANRLFNLEYIYLVVYLLATSLTLLFLSRYILSIITFSIASVLSFFSVSVGVIGIPIFSYGFALVAYTQLKPRFNPRKWFAFKRVLFAFSMLMVVIVIFCVNESARQGLVSLTDYVGQKIRSELGVGTTNQEFSYLTKLNSNTSALTRSSQWDAVDSLSMWPIGTGAPLPASLLRDGYNVEFSPFNILHKYGYILGGILIMFTYLFIPWKIFRLYRNEFHRYGGYRHDSERSASVIVLALHGSVCLGLSFYSLSNPVFGSPQFILSSLALLHYPLISHRAN